MSLDNPDCGGFPRHAPRRWVPQVPVPRGVARQLGLPVLAVNGRLPDRAGNVDVRAADLIPDLEAIRRGAAAGATAYQKPEDGVPKTDLSEDVQVSLGLAGTAVQPDDILSGGKVKSDLLPSYVDDVIEVANYAALPETGESGKIYVTLDTNKTYRWGGTAYVEISNPDLSDYVQKKGGATAGNFARFKSDGDIEDSGLSKDDVESLFFAQYYPEGNVKSAAEFTAGIKYDNPDAVSRTITVKPFCSTGDSDNDNSDLEGRVVIPPFVDASGNGYITDDGTRYKVVGVSDDVPNDENLNLTAIVVPATVTSIGNYAFSSCGLLSSVSLPAVTTIGNYAFGSQRLLTTVSLPAATSIGEGAFINGPLTTVDFGDSPRSDVPSLGSNAFSGVPTSCQIIVPYTQYDEWKAASGWRDLPQEFVRHAEKADKPATFTAGNLAEFDSNGNPTDRGIKPSDKLDVTSAAPAWVSGTSYAANALVTYNGAVYRCKANTVSPHTATPDTDTTHWEARPVSGLFLPLAGGAMTGQLQVFNLLSAIRNVDTAGAVSGARFILRGTTNEHYIQFAYQDDKYGLFVKNGPFDAGTFYPMDNIAAVPNKADISAIPYSIGTPIIIDTASSETVEGETVYYGAATLADRTANVVQVTAATALDELRITFPAATSGKVHDFGLRVEIGTGSAALTAPALVPIAPTGETIKIENNAKEIPALADGTATAKGVTLLYFSENAPGVFVVKGEQVEEVA